MTSKTIAYPAIVIHHSTLEDMLTRGPFGRDPDIPLYLDRNHQNHALITHAVIICVRAYNHSAGTIHSYTPYRAGTGAWGARHFGEDTQHLDKLWTAAGVILDDIDATLSYTRQVYRGIIDLGPIEPVAGQPWSINGR